MSNQKNNRWSRRDFLGAAALAGTSALLGLPSETATAEPPPETTRIRLVQAGGMCQAPKYVAEDLLRAEGFTDVQYIKKDTNLGNTMAVAGGEADISIQFSGPVLIHADGGSPIVMLSWCPHRLFRAVCDGKGPCRAGFKGQDRRCTSDGFAAACLYLQHGGLRRP